MPVVKLGASRRVVIPQKIHDQLGLKPGDYLEVELRDGKVVFAPMGRIDKHLDEAMEDLGAGRVHGPFGSVDVMRDALHQASASTPPERPRQA